MADQVITVQVVSVGGSPTRSGKTKYALKDGNGQEWVTFDPQLAMKAGPYQGQMASLTVNVSPSPDGKYTNYYLNDIGPAIAGAAVAQPAAVAAVPDAAALAAAGVGITAPAEKQSRYSDAELWEFARKDGIAVAAQVFAGIGEELDLQKFYGLAEAASKFVRLRQHQGWVPGVEIESLKPKPEDVVAIVNAEIPGAVTQGAPEPTPEPTPAAASAAVAGGGEVEWD